MKTKKTFQIVTLGCRTNQYESAAYIDQLKSMGYSPSQPEEEADLCIINTCTVTHSADVRSRAQLNHLMQAHPKAKMVVTGCWAEKNPKELPSDERIVVVPNLEKEKLLQKIFPEEKELPEFSIRNFEAHTRAFVKVQDGCNSFCTYCIIPYVRGRSRCRPLEEVVREVKGLVEQGYKEVVLTGINIGDYQDRENQLADLVKAVDRVEGLQRLRLSSIDADEVDEKLTQAILQGETTCPSMHIVLQSGSNVILKKMNRKYTKQMFFHKIEQLRKRSPEFTFTTDVIVGFPGESEEDFSETLQAIEKVRFAKVHMFPYSPRERTRAALYPNRIDSKTMQKRKNELLRYAEKVAFSLRQEYVGEKVEVLLEQREDPEWISGHTRNFLRVKVASPHLRSNEIATIHLQENTPDGLIGTLDVS